MPRSFTNAIDKPAEMYLPQRKRYRSDEGKAVVPAKLGLVERPASARWDAAEVSSVTK
jgi:hypothetical protein